MPGPMHGGGPGGPGGPRRPGGGPGGPMGGPMGPRGPMPPPPPPPRPPYGGFRRRPYGYGCLGWCLTLLACCSGIILMIGMLLF